MRGIISVQLGENGSLIFHKGEVIQTPSFRVPIVDTAGAGDTYTSAFIAAIMKEFSIEDTGIYANAAAALKCQGKGARTAIPKSKAVFTFLQSQGIKISGER
jgi:sugar/nucleoside kinase (ribokinase family)